MNTLIVYSTKHGSAARCADILLEKARCEATAVNAKDKPQVSLQEYGRIILGASVYVGKIQPEMLAFCEANKELLLERKIGLFICSGNHSESGREYLKLFGEDLYAHASVKELFGDEIHWESMNFFERLTMRIIKKSKGSSSNLEMENISSFISAMNL